MWFLLEITFVTLSQPPSKGNCNHFVPYLFVVRHKFFPFTFPFDFIFLFLRIFYMFFGSTHITKTDFRRTRWRRRTRQNINSSYGHFIIKASYYRNFSIFRFFLFACCCLFSIILLILWPFRSTNSVEICEKKWRREKRKSKMSCFRCQLFIFFIAFACILCEAEGVCGAKNRPRRLSLEGNQVKN